MAEGVFPKVNGDVLFASEVNSLAQNELKGISATLTAPASGWHQTPVGTANITDHDLTTTVTTSPQMGDATNSAGEFAVFKWDMGSLKDISWVGWKYGITSNIATNSTITVDVSTNDIVWAELDTQSITGTGPSTFLSNIAGVMENIRYVRIKWTVTSFGSGAVATFVPYEVSAKLF